MVILALAVALVSTGCGRNLAGVSTRRILGADAEPHNWLSHGRDYGEQRFSPLTDIDVGNVADLGLAWSTELRTRRGASATPIVVDGVMFVTSAWSVVHALDAGDGSELWVYDPEVDRTYGAYACCDVVNRGVAVYGSRVFVGTIDGRLVALDAATGTVDWETVTANPDRHYTITGAPRAANGLVFIGNGGAEYGVRGYVSAYEAESGELAWRFYTVPGDPAAGPDGAASDPVMERATATWNGEWWRYGGGGTVWDAIVYDAHFDQLLVGVGNGSPWNRQIRSPGGGDNLFLASILALDASTGAYRWHYQTTPGETWDFTATQPIVLADLSIDGVPRKVAMQAPKNGFFYVLDRATGGLISAEPFVPLAHVEDTPPGAPVAWAWSIDPETGRPRENPGVRYVDRAALVKPGPMGAHNWHPMSFSPATGLVYLPTTQHGNPGGYRHDPDFVFRPGLWNTGTGGRGGSASPPDPAASRSLRTTGGGHLVAWDPVRQRAAWTAMHPGVANGGTLATAGDLVFQGTLDGRFVALDARNGELLWQYETGAPTLAGPISYAVDGTQYVAVLSGYGSGMMLFAGAVMPREGVPARGRVHVLRLHGDAPAPTGTIDPSPTPAPPAVEVTDKEYQAGAALYGMCSRCHGFGVISGGALPDLRKTTRLRSAELWREAVIDGVLEVAGMPAFADYLTPEQAEMIRRYVIVHAAAKHADEQARAAGDR